MKPSYIFLLLFLSSHCFINDHNEQCSIRDSCSNSTTISPSIYKDEIFIRSRNCFCDVVCKQYGDCCEHSFSNSRKTYYECTDFLSPTLVDKPLKVAPLSVWMRTRCLPMYIGSSSDVYCRNLHNQSFKNNPLLWIPVTSLQSNITYRNYFCAYCNNDADLNVQSWEYVAYCGKNRSISSQQMMKNTIEEVNNYLFNLTQNCTKTIVYPRISGTNKPSIFIRPCKKSLPRTCPSEISRDLARNCSLAGIAYRYENNSNIVYPNRYCAECNRKSHSQITCSDPKLASGMFPADQQMFPPLSILFNPTLLKYYFNSDLNRNLTTEMIYSLSYTCPKSNEFYHLFKRQCLELPQLKQQIMISLQCTHPILTSEKSIRFPNGSLYLITESIQLTKYQYIILNDHQLIFCADHWKKIRPKFPFYRHILSTISTSISLVCLILFIVAFYLIPSLHNLPGKCLLCLSFSIFFGQSVFLFTSDLQPYSSLCLTFGILIHYFYLSSFFWLFIIAYHIYSTFHYQQLVRQEKHRLENQYLLNYNILIWCLTGFIILIACLIQHFNPQSSFSPNYGDFICSISKSNALITFFLLPIGVLLLMIIILFIKTIFAIHHSHKVAKLANKSSTNNFVLIYARLASLMGLQWILLINALVIQQNWAWILFETVNSLPGMFICLGFLCSQRLCKNIKEDLTNKLVKQRQTSSNHTASTGLMGPVTQRER
ncbi:hypothetical protein I4U23_023698 [Adineta vaga]|nr:hypothetical protein I4U23_023698 [Adineta vaga]